MEPIRRPTGAQAEWEPGDFAWSGVSVVRLLERRPDRAWTADFVGFVQHGPPRTVHEKRLVAFHRCDEFRVTGVQGDRAAQAEGVRIVKELLQPPNGPWGSKAGRDAAPWKMALGGVVRRFDLDVPNDADPVQNGADDDQPGGSNRVPSVPREDPLPEPANVVAQIRAEPQEVEVEEQQASTAPPALPVKEQPRLRSILRRRHREEIEEDDSIEEEHEIAPPAKKTRVHGGSWWSWVKSWFGY